MSNSTQPASSGGVEAKVDELFALLEDKNFRKALKQKLKSNLRAANQLVEIAQPVVIDAEPGFATFLAYW